MDIMMPEMDGYQTMQVIRAEPGLPPAADHRADRQGDEGRPREMPRGRRLRLPREAGQHRAAAVGPAHVAAPLKPAPRCDRCFACESRPGPPRGPPLPGSPRDSLPPPHYPLPSPAGGRGEDRGPSPRSGLQRHPTSAPPGQDEVRGLVGPSPRPRHPALSPLKAGEGLLSVEGRPVRQEPTP